MARNQLFVMDFDSTFTEVEAMDVLGEISLKNHPQKEESLKKISDITHLGMEGKIAFRESLEERVKLLHAHRDHLPELIGQLKKRISPSVRRNRQFFEEHSDFIYIISNGFEEFIIPIVTSLGVKSENVYANRFSYDKDGNITGYDQTILLSQDNGKVKLMQSLQLDGEIIVIGDGWNDYEIRKAGLANKFFAFTENIERDIVTQHADHVAPSLDEVLYVQKMNKVLSYPKSRIKVLLLENVHPQAVNIFKTEGYQVEVHPAGLDEDELAEKIRDVSILGIRSKTNVTQKVLESANRLIAIGAFCIGTNQIDLNEAQKRGVAVFNAPFSNTRSVVELAIAEMIMLMRRIPDRSVKMHEGIWDKSAKLSNEVRGKRLGIVGYGNIGTQLSVLAEAMGMKVYFYDVVERLAIGNATKCASMDELFSLSDIISFHVDGRKENHQIIGEQEISKMNDGVILMNLSRGHVMDIEALKKGVSSGKIRGLAVDVFPEEPKSNQDAFVSSLQGLPNTILSPHIGGSTEEAQEDIGHFVPNKIIEYVNTGSTTNSVNFPELQLPSLKNAHRLIHIHLNKSGVLADINRVLANHNANIVGQYLKTNEVIGYTILDIDKAYDKEVIGELKKIANTIKFRILY